MPRDLKLTKSALDGVERWMDEKGPGGKSFRESLEAGGVIASDLVVVAGAINGLLNCGLTREALVILIQARGPRPHGRPSLTLTQVDDVLTAMANLDSFLAPAKGAKQ